MSALNATSSLTRRATNDVPCGHLLNGRAADVAKAPEAIRRAFHLWARPGAEQLFDLETYPYELNLDVHGRSER